MEALPLLLGIAERPDGAGASVPAPMPTHIPHSISRASSLTTTAAAFTPSQADIRRHAPPPIRPTQTTATLPFSPFPVCLQAHRLAQLVLERADVDALRAESLTILARAEHALGQLTQAWTHYQQVRCGGWVVARWGGGWGAPGMCLGAWQRRCDVQVCLGGWSLEARSLAPLSATAATGLQTR